MMSPRPSGPPSRQSAPNAQQGTLSMRRACFLALNSPLVVLESQNQKFLFARNSALFISKAVAHQYECS
jgi:hypothetical protein